MIIDPFTRGLVFGVAIGAIATMMLLLVGYELFCMRQEQRAAKARRAAQGPRVDIQAERVRLLRDECRQGEYPRASPEEETRKMEIHVEVADD